MKLLTTYNGAGMIRIFLFLIAVLSLEVGYGAQKRALLIGIGNYPQDTEWGKTHSANDVAVLKHSITAKGFSDVTTLIDAQATKSNTLKKLEELYNTCEDGDVFLFYFSGHGQLITDYEGDETDHYDEALVMYGAPKGYDASYHNEHHLTDDELSAFFNRMRMKLGNKGEVIVLVDAGFGWSDSISTENIRGGAMPLEASHDHIDRGTIGRFEAGILDDLPYGKPSDRYSPIIHMTAIDIRLPAFEHNGNGVFTMALARAIDEQTDSVTYEELFAHVKLNSTAINTMQIPLMEGKPDESMFKQITKDSGLGSSVIEQVSHTATDSEALEILVDLKETEKGVIKNEVGKTDWEKSFFTP